MEKMEKQTAVEWLIEKVNSKNWQEKFIWHKEEDFKKAKEMEKEQMEKMYNHAMWALVDGNGHGQDFNEYYNETYESKTNI